MKKEVHFISIEGVGTLIVSELQKAFAPILSYFIDELVHIKSKHLDLGGE